MPFHRCPPPKVSFPRRLQNAARARAPWPLTICGAILLALAIALRPQTPPIYAAEPVAGPALVSDMAAWPASGMVPVGHFGGTVAAVAAEADRPIVWAAVGPRVLAFEEAWDGLHLVGRTPAFRGEVTQVAAGAGRVLVLIYPGESPMEVWLIDGRDPHWPRAARKLAVGGAPAGIGVFGATGVIVAGNDVIRLDLEDPSRPVELGRQTLPLLDSDRYYAQIAVDDRRVAVASPPLGISVLDLQVGGALGAPRRVLSRSDFAVALHGRHLLSIDSGGSAISYDLDDPEGSFATVIDPEVDGVAAIASDGRRVYTLESVMNQASVTLRSYQLEQDGTGRAEGARTLEHPPLGFPSAAASLAAGRTALHYGLNDGTRIESLPKASVRNPAAGMSSQWRPIVCQVDDLELSGSQLLVGEWYGGLSMLDARRPDLPRWRGRASRTIVPGTYYNVDRMQVVGDQLWIVDRNTFHVIELEDDRWGRELYRHPNGAESGVTFDGRHGYIMERGGLRVFEPRPGQAPKLVGQVDVETAQVLDLVVSGGNVWTVELEGTSKGQLQAFDVSDPTRPRLVGTMRLPQAAVGLGTMDGYLLAVQHHRTSAVTLHVIDGRDPRQAREIGAVEISPANPDAQRPYEATLAVHGADVLVVHPNLGIARVDLSVPSRPVIIGRMELPSQAWRVARDGNHAWVSLFFNGVLALRLDPPDQEPRHRVWLPSLTLPGD